MTQITFQNPDIRLGFHIGKRPKLRDTFEYYVLDTPMRGYQLYTGPSRGYKVPAIDAVDTLEAKKLLERNGKYVVQHAALIYNIAGATKGRSDPKFQHNLECTCEGLLREIDLGVALGSDGVVVHTGSAQDKEYGMRVVTKTIEHVLCTPTQDAKRLAAAMNIPLDEFISRRRLILENSAGGGSTLGISLDDYAEIYSNLKPSLRNQTHMCIDTAHIFEAGQFDFGDPAEVARFYDEFDEKIGLEHLAMFHLNDSRTESESHKDSHENLGLGYIFGVDYGRDGTEGLSELLKRAEERRTILVGEPPSRDKDGGDGPGGVWDYSVVRQLAPLEDTVTC